MLKTVSRTFSIAKCLGWENIPPRLLYLGKKRSGLLAWQTAPRRYAQGKYLESVGNELSTKQLWQDKQSSFFPLMSSATLQEVVPAAIWDEQVTQVCRSAVSGKYPYFSRWQGDIGWPPSFNRDPVNDLDWSTADHWTNVSCSETPHNDIKLVWEASRLTMAYYFSREYRYSGDERWAEYLWELIDSWINQNPVNQTVAWECAQEVSFRLMAILWGVFSTLDSNAATPERLADVHFLVWQFGKRIAATTEYGISQENNHALSEAAGLWTIGLLFPEFHESNRWKKKGKASLVRESSRQIYEDGSYVQHSFSYHRVMLDDLIWSLKLGELNDEQLPAIVRERFSAATIWLSQFVDESNGRVPNYGANDGANVLPLSCTDYLDYRPTLRAAQAIAGLDAAIGAEPLLNEKAIWLTGVPPQENTSPKSRTWSANDGGYHRLKSGNGQLMIRCGNYRDRPSHSDMLHVDLWYGGVNVLRDSGSFRYHHEDPILKAYFPSVRAHNTVQVKNYEQMTKGPSFLWLDWPKSTSSLKITDTGAVLECSASFTGENQQYTHHRTITQDGDTFKITDAIPTDETFQIRWHLAPEVDWKEIGSGRWTGDVNGVPYTISIDGHRGIALETAWESLYYGEKKRHPVLVIDGKSDQVTSTFGPGTNLEVVDFG